MAQPEISKLACSAPTHVATSNFAASLHHLGVEIAKETNTPSPLVLRGYAIKTEIAAFIKIAARQSRGAEVEEDIIDAYKARSRWSLNPSPCEWLFQVVGAKGFSLAASDLEALRPLQCSVETDRKFEGLLPFVAGQISFAEVGDYTPNDVHAEPARQMVRRLLEDIVMAADAVCATPFGLNQAPYAVYYLAQGFAAGAGDEDELAFVLYSMIGGRYNQAGWEVASDLNGQDHPVTLRKK